jgi:hypothetical protein
MKNALLLPIWVALFFAIAACNTSKKVEPTPEKTLLQAFSDTLQKDTFKVMLQGKESKDMSLIFTITNAKGTQIYKEEIKAETLLKSYLASEDLEKEGDKIKFLNEEVNFFFDEEHFLIPAVTPEEKPDNNAPDKAFYDELKQTKLNGFAYSLGKDKQLYIAWSVKEQRVKVYYKCC